MYGHIRYYYPYYSLIEHEDLSAALDYYGSDKARLDFLNNKEAPAELLGKSRDGNSYTNNQRNASVVDHLFDG